MRADRAGLELDLHEGDVLGYSPGRAFDVVLDSGCLHHLPKGKVSRYRPGSTSGSLPEATTSSFTSFIAHACSGYPRARST